MADGDKNDEAQIHKEALEKFNESVDGSDLNRENYYEDIKFARMGDQWDDTVKKQRKQEGRPALTINKLPAFIRAIVNESRQNRPSIQVTPSDNFGDEETAQVIGGLIKSIERRSSAEVAYATALDCAVTGGFGFFRVDIDYVNDESFSIEAKINRIPNPLSVHWDTTSTRFDAADWDHCFVSDFMKKEEYEDKYPGASTSSFETDSREETGDQWLQDDSIRIAEYFCRKPDSYELQLIAMTDPQTGEVKTQTVREQDLITMATRFFENQQLDPSIASNEEELIQAFMSMSGSELRQTREVETHKIMRYIMNGDEILETDLWPGKKMPICPVWGEEVFVDGRRHFRSLVRDAKDSQQMFNFWRSASTELVALAPKTPFIGPKGFIPKGDETKWASANTRSHAYLEYNKSAGEAPSRQPFAGVPAGVLQEAANNIDDMKSIMGIFDSSLGARSNETSGKAIMARERQGDVSNFHFLDNMSRAISYCGEVLIDVIPSVYSAEDSIRILGEDEKAKVVKLTQEAGGSVKSGPNGGQALYNLSVGVYDVNVKSGPSFSTQREETRETLIEIMRQVPDAAPFVGDVLLDHMDFVGADLVAKRLKHLLPPEIKQAEEAENQSDNPEMAAMQQQLQAKDQQMQQAQQQVMQEIERMKAENEAMKQDKQAQMIKAESDAKKSQADAMAKGEELRIREMELELKAKELAAKPSYEDQLQLDMLAKAADQEFQAQENAKDRQVDLAKVYVSHQEYAMDKEQSTADALLKAAEAIAAPKELVRDESGNIIGSRRKSSL